MEAFPYTEDELLSLLMSTGSTQQTAALAEHQWNIPRNAMNGVAGPTGMYLWRACGVGVPLMQTP